jgi:hypothetical protein
MFDRWISFCLQNRGAVLAVTVITAIGGWFSFKQLAVEAFPDPTDTQVQVITLYPGQPSEEVERQIGLPLERALNGTPGLARLRNLSLFGLSFVTLTFVDGMDGMAARAQVLERLREAELPEGIIPQLGPFATPIGEVYRYTLAGAGGDPRQLRTLQDWVVRPALLRVHGVADVVSYGGLVRELHVQPDPARLASFGLTLDDLEQSIKAGSLNASGGVLERGAEQFILRSDGLFHRMDDLRLVSLGSREGTPVFLSDVADVSEGWAPRQGVVSRGAESGRLLLSVGRLADHIQRPLGHGAGAGIPAGEARLQKAPQRILGQLTRIRGVLRGSSELATNPAGDQGLDHCIRAQRAVHAPSPPSHPGPTVRRARGVAACWGLARDRELGAPSTVLEGWVRFSKRGSSTWVTAHRGQSGFLALRLSDGEGPAGSGRLIARLRGSLSEHPPARGPAPRRLPPAAAATTRACCARIR